MENKFGPKNSLQFDDAEVWRDFGEKKNLHFVGCSNGLIAQDKNETCCGFWSFNLKKGWMEA